MKRRRFLCAASLTSASSLLLPLFSRGMGLAKGREHVFVLLELKGGNDGLNTVIPYRDPAYIEARPTLAISDGPLLTRELMMHPALTPLLPAWKARRLAFALGVGWKEPNRSHFKAQDQWATGKPSGEGQGWLAARLATANSQRSLVALGPSGSAALEGPDVLSVQMQLLMGPGLSSTPQVGALDPSRAGENLMLRRMLELERAGSREVDRLSSALAPLPQELTLPSGNLAQQVGLALRLIGTAQPPAVIQLAHPSFAGFDTHANQRPRHERSLSELAGALAAFDEGLQHMPHRPEVTLLATSEFGRRLRQNASGGTDHGSASVAFLLGDAVPHPFLGAYPSLTSLDERGDMIPVLAPDELYRKSFSA